MKSISLSNLTTTENNLKVEMQLTVHHYPLFQTTSNTVGNISCIKKHKKCLCQQFILLKSHTEAIRCLATINPHLFGSGGRNGIQRRTKASSDTQNHDASVEAACCGLQKGTSLDEATLNSEKIKRVAIAIIRLHFLEGISK